MNSTDTSSEMYVFNCRHIGGFVSHHSPPATKECSVHSALQYTAHGNINLVYITTPSTKIHVCGGSTTTAKPVGRAHKAAKTPPGGSRGEDGDKKGSSSRYDFIPTKRCLQSPPIRIVLHVCVMVLTQRRDKTKQPKSISPIQ